MRIPFPLPTKRFDVWLLLLANVVVVFSLIAIGEAASSALSLWSFRAVAVFILAVLIYIIVWDVLIWQAYVALPADTTTGDYDTDDGEPIDTEENENEEILVPSTKLTQRTVPRTKIIAGGIPVSVDEEKLPEEKPDG